MPVCIVLLAVDAESDPPRWTPVGAALLRDVSGCVALFFAYIRLVAAGRDAALVTAPDSQKPPDVV